MDVRITNEPRVVPGWFYHIKNVRSATWSMTTGLGGSEAWACEIGRGCRSCDGNLHLSVPCSLAAEAGMIGALLARSWHESEFLLFFRLYLVMLSEFVKNLADVAGVMGLEVAEPPVFVCSWCNNVAKHRVALLIQHHPACVIADKYGAQWRRFEASLPSQTIVDACGIPRPLELIGRNWFKGHHKSDTAGANDAKQAVIVIPPLIDFLEPTIAYLREFVDACHADP